MRINLMFGTDNDAFREDPCAEVSRILKELAADIGSRTDLKHGDAIIVRDANGNRVGVFDVFKD